MANGDQTDRSEGWGTEAGRYARDWGYGSGTFNTLMPTQPSINPLRGMSPEQIQGLYAGGMGPDFLSAELIKRAGKAAWDFVQVPGKVASGDLTPYPGYANTVDPAAYAGQMAGYGLGTGALLAPRVPASMFGGLRAETARINPEDLYSIATPGGSRTLREAFDLMNRGANRDEVFHRTGWFQGGDNQWRFNISDKDMELKLNNLRKNNWDKTDSSRVIYGPEFRFGSKPQTLDDIVDHPELFAAYPELKNVEVRPVPLGSMFTHNGAYDKNKNILYLNMLKPEVLKSTTIHEMQHAVQGIEGWARGGDPGEFLYPTFSSELSDVMKLQSDMEGEFTAMGARPNDVQAVHGIGVYDRPMLSGLKPETIETVNRLPDKMIDDYKTAINWKRDLNVVGAKAHEDYMNLMGEQEARAAELQTLLGRWDQAPWQMQDYRGTDWGGRPVAREFTPYEQQIYVPQSHPAGKGTLLPLPVFNQLM